jgi:CMP-N-acetylneuraminic acid synthetase
MPKITAYTPTYNCGKFLEKSIESVLKQTYADFELIVINDGSTDDTSQVLQKYINNPKIRIIEHKKNIGFVKTAAVILPKTKGEYIIRVDGDDFLDENTFLVMASILDKHPEIGMVYSDYFHVNERGEIMHYFKKKNLQEEMELMDLPANGAGVMIRRSCYLAVGGYRKDIKCQDKYDLWIKFINKFKPYALNLPLYFYRRHGSNISNKPKLILETRRYIKRKFIGKNKKSLKVLGIIPTRAKFPIYPDFPYKKIGGRPLISYSINALKEAPFIDRAVFTTEDKELADFAKRLKIKTILRPKELAESTSHIEETINFVVEKLEKEENYSPDIVVVLFITSPLITKEHVQEAIDTLLIFNADSVISVKEDRRFHHQHGKYGLSPLFEKRLLKYEKDILYEETGSLLVTRREFISKKNILGKRIGHILLTEDEAVDIDNKFQFWLVDQIIKNKKNINKLI